MGSAQVPHSANRGPGVAGPRPLSATTTPTPTAKIASEAVQIGLVGLLTRPVIKAVFPSDTRVPTVKSPAPAPTTRDSTSEASTPEPLTPSSPTTSGPPVFALGPVGETDFRTASSAYEPSPQQKQLAALGPAPSLPGRAADSPRPQPVITDNSYVPVIYNADRVLPVPIEAIQRSATPAQSQPSEAVVPAQLAVAPLTPTEVVEPIPSVGVEEIAQPSMSVNEPTQDEALVERTQSLKLADGEPAATDFAARSATPSANGHANGSGFVESNNLGLGAPLVTGNTGEASTVDGSEQRPSMHERPSRSYIKPVAIVTNYEPALSEAERERLERPKSAAGTERPKSVASVRNMPPPLETGAIKRSASRTGSIRSQKGSIMPGSPANGSVRRLPPIADTVNGGDEHDEHDGIAVGEFASAERQQGLQGRQASMRSRERVSLVDDGPVARAMSPRPQSAFGHRPQPALVGGAERPESRADGAYGQDQMAGVGAVGVGRSLSRAHTLGRNGTLSRAANGGTVGSRRGAFGRGAGLSVGTQPEEVLGRDDIHTRAELSERLLGDDTLRRLSQMEKKDAKRLSKIIKSEGAAEAKAVSGSIKELERLARLQKDAAGAERKSQLRLSKYIAREHKARIRFLKEKERYEKIEGMLRNAENDYEERRDHAAGLTAQVAEKTQDLDDLRAQKAADDREREVKLLALKNPAHS